MGEIFALACALIWAFAVILFRTSVDHVSPFALNLFRVSISGILLAASLAVTGSFTWPEATWRDMAYLAASGVIGIAISDTLFHKALKLVGAGVCAIVDVLYTPFSVLLAWLILSEELATRQFLGMGLVMSGIFIATSSEGHATAVSRRQLWLGVLYGTLAMVTVALGVVLAKPVVSRAPVLWTTCVRQVVAAVVMWSVVAFLPARRDVMKVFVPSQAWKSMLPGTFLGSYLALIVWLASVKFTKVGVSAILTQTSTVFVLILARIFLKESFTTRKLIATVLALAGIALTV